MSKDKTQQFKKDLLELLQKHKADLFIDPVVFNEKTPDSKKTHRLFVKFEDSDKQHLIL